ncbi:DUF3558 domain-containing protein [Mycobacterium sp. pUA109]|uniref:DUF3558 domain-containing protein n=1 Tax=Mycobacterium sp. pUA109 TaxID=3238982 RepID=UPI00351B5E7F
MSRQRGAAPRQVLVAAVAAVVAACSPTPPAAAPPSTTALRDAHHGPFFPLCGGISDQTVAELTGASGLVNTGQNPTGCQWLRGGVVWPRVTFAWYRGSPIGRERKIEQLSRTRVEDLTLEGRSGFRGVENNATLGDYICEIAIQFFDDFIEWSVSFDVKPFPDPCPVTEELTRRSIANAH